MSRLDELIKQYCSEGVQDASFGDVATYTRGITYNKSQEAHNNDISPHKVLRANNITLSSNALNFDDVKLVKAEVRVRPEQMLKRGDILICAGSGSKEHVGKVAFIREDMGYTFGGFMAVIRPMPKLSNRYLFHVLTSHLFSEYLTANLNSTTINNLNYHLISGFRFPLPPLPVQQEIVHILDSFTDLQDNLQQELEARKKQLKYYIDKSFANAQGPIKKLGDIGIMKKGTGIQKADFIDEGFPCIHYGQVHTYYGTYATKTKSFVRKELAKSLATHGDLIIATTSEDVEACCKAVAWLGSSDVAVSGDAHIFHHNQDPKYISYLFQSEEFASQKRMNSSGAKVVRVHGDSMLKFSFRIPSLDDQKRVVDSLESIEKVIENINLELSARQKQYEYYREQLLTF